MLVFVAIKHPALSRQTKRTMHHKCHANYLTFIPSSIPFSKHRPAEGTLAASYLCLKVDEHIYQPHLLSSHISSVGEISTLASAFSWSEGKPCYMYHIASHMPRFFLCMKIETFCPASVTLVFYIYQSARLTTSPIDIIRQNVHIISISSDHLFARKLTLALK